MNWYYATKDKTQVGPIDQTALEGLFRSGTITADTLVWREGQPDWLPYSSVLAPSAPAPGSAPSLPRCAECGQVFPPEEMITLAGRTICATCKPLALQKFQEGVVSFGSPVDAEELWRRIEQRGFDFTISSVLSRSWSLVKNNFWPCVGVTLLCYLIMMGASQVPLLGLFAAFFVQPQIMAGLNWYFVKQFRGEEATINDSFAGFRRGYGQQALYMLIVFAIMFGLIILCAVPMALIIPAIAKASNSGGGGSTIYIWIIIGVMIPIILGIWYIIICWIFTPLLILDKGLTATKAMKLSRRVVQLRIWKLIALFLVLALLSLLGVAALLVGIIFVLPVLFAAISRVYEDAFGEEGPVTLA